MRGTAVPDPTLQRLSLYHCYLTELQRVAAPIEITSRALAEELELTEETVRRDLSFVGTFGKPGAGYDLEALMDALTAYLGLTPGPYPILMVGTAGMLGAMRTVFPAEIFGVKPAAYFSELPDDAGKAIDDITVRHLSDIPRIDPALGINVALVACSPSWAQVTLDLLGQAGITGVLLLTPIIKLHVPDGMNITKLRMPCDIKSLACRCQVPIGDASAE